MKGDEAQVNKAAGAVGAAVKDSKTAQAEAMLERAMKTGATPKEILGLTDSMVEGIYAQAYRLYNTGKYDHAIKLFRMLTAINSGESKYLMGLAACFHMEKDYESAVDTYTILGVIDPNSPISFYHASDCYIKMDDIPSAIVSLDMAIERAGEKPEFRALKDRAKLTRESLKKELEESLKES